MHTTRTNKTNKTSKRDPYFPYYVPADRIASILTTWMESEIKTVDAQHQEYGLGRAERLTGIQARSLYRILQGESTVCTFDFADKLLCGLGLVGLWHVAPEKGGLADWYEADAENPLPDLPPPTEKQLEVSRRSKEQRAAKKAAVAA